MPADAVYVFDACAVIALLQAEAGAGVALLNLEHVLFNLMAGIREEDKTANDTAYKIVFGLAYPSFISAPILGIAYAVCVIRAWKSAPGRRGQILS